MYLIYIFNRSVKSVSHLLSSDQVDAALSAVGHLSTQVIQDQQLTPAALQQNHLILHL